MDTACVPSTQTPMTPLRTEVSNLDSDSSTPQKGRKPKRGRYKKIAETPLPQRIAQTKIKYPHKSCQKGVFFKGRGWNGDKYSHYDPLYRDMKRFGKAAVSMFYNVQTNSTRKAWYKLEVQRGTKKALCQLLKDLHPNPECRQLLAESDETVLKHIIHHVLREFKACYKKRSEPKNYEDIPQALIPNSLKDWMKHLDSAGLRTKLDDIAADGHADLTANTDENSPNDHLNSHANVSLAESTFGGNIEDGNAMGDSNLIPGYSSSQDHGSPSLPRNDVQETEFLIGTPFSVGTPLPNIRLMDEDANTSSFQNNAHYDTIVGTGNSNPMEDMVRPSLPKMASRQKSFFHQEIEARPQWHIDSPAPQSPSTHTVPDMTPRPHWRGHAPVPQPPSRHTVPNRTLLNDSCFNQNPESDAFVNFDSLTRSNTHWNENTTVVGDSSAVPQQNKLPSSNLDTRGIYSVGQGMNTFPNDFDNAAGNWSSSHLCTPPDGYSTNTDNYRPTPTSTCHGYFAQNGFNQQQSSPHLYYPRNGYPINTENYRPSPTSTHHGYFAQNGFNQQQSSLYLHPPRDGYPRNPEDYTPAPTSIYNGHFAQNGMNQQQMQQCTISNSQYNLPSLHRPPYGLPQRYPDI